MGQSPTFKDAASQNSELFATVKDMGGQWQQSFVT